MANLTCLANQTCTKENDAFVCTCADGFAGTRTCSGIKQI